MSKDYKVPFGKYGGSTISDIAEFDPGYLVWLSNNASGEAREAAELFLIRSNKKTDVRKKFYIIFNPDHHSPPRKLFSTMAQAEEVAKAMAEKLTPHTFYVMEAKAAFSTSKPPVVVKRFKK